MQMLCRTTDMKPSSTLTCKCSQQGSQAEASAQCLLDTGWTKCHRMHAKIVIENSEVTPVEAR